MMLYLPPEVLKNSPYGLGVAHVTLHTALANVPSQLSTDSIRDTTILTQTFMHSLGCSNPRIAGCALNPHAGEQGLFGTEEQELISPAFESLAQLMCITGPLPADTVFQRAVHGEFDGVVAMYHDQGHIAMKLLGFRQAVNVTLGLPLVRTSPSHGTAFDIAGQGCADASGMWAAVKTAIELVRQRQLAID
jgi:4-hydroxythreonine-4-phosphate dehydrogenase